MNWSQRRRRNRAADRVEQQIRRGARHGHCYFCALSGEIKKATHGELCERHFNEVEFPRAPNPY